MSTRGTYGVRIEGQDKLTYNHYDSYPEGLGVDLVGQVRQILESNECGLDWLHTKARDMRMVYEQNIPSEIEVESYELKRFHQPVGNGKDWRAWLRGLQGQLDQNLDIGLMVGYNDYILNSLHCEYGYIVNLDELHFEVYVGFQHLEHDAGRYARRWTEAQREAERWRGPFHYPCALAGAFDLLNIPPDWQQRAFAPPVDPAMRRAIIKAKQPLEGQLSLTNLGDDSTSVSC